MILRNIKNLFENEEKTNYYKHLNKIRISCLKDIINNLKKLDTWKIQLAIANNFISSIDNDEVRVMRSESNNIKTMINDEAETVVK